MGPAFSQYLPFHLLNNIVIVPFSYLLKTQLFNFLGNMGYMSVKD